MFVSVCMRHLKYLHVRAFVNVCMCRFVCVYVCVSVCMVCVHFSSFVIEFYWSFVKSFPLTVRNLGSLPLKDHVKCGPPLFFSIKK